MEVILRMWQSWDTHTGCLNSQCAEVNLPMKSQYSQYAQVSLPMKSQYSQGTQVSLPILTVRALRPRGATQLELESHWEG